MLYSRRHIRDRLPSLKRNLFRTDFICFTYFPYHTARSSCCHYHRRNVFVYNAACANYTSLANRYTSADNRISANPDIPFSQNPVLMMYRSKGNGLQSVRSVAYQPAFQRHADGKGLSDQDILCGLMFCTHTVGKNTLSYEAQQTQLKFENTFPIFRTCCDTIYFFRVKEKRPRTVGKP